VTKALISNTEILDESQAGKEAALLRYTNALEAFGYATIETFGETTPQNYAEGTLHIPGVGATDNWLGLDNTIVQRTDQGWLVYLPPVGLRKNIATATGIDIRQWDGTDWNLIESLEIVS